MSTHGNSDVRPKQKYRVVQWATGNIGTRALKTTIEHPQLELVGVYVRDPAKVGLDAGALCDVAATGVKATGSIDEIIALGADCILYMPLLCDFGEICRLLSSGANIVTTRGEFHNPAALPADIRKQVEVACYAGGTSIHATGSSPGFITEAVPLVLTSIQRRLDRLIIDEFADLSLRNSPQLLFEVMGFGKPAITFNESRLIHIRNSFGPSLRLLADAIGLPLDGVEVIGETALSRQRVSITAGDLEKGTIAAQRITVQGIRDGRSLLTFRANWYCTKDIDADWNLRDTGWHISVEGDTPLEVALRFSIPPERFSATTPGYTAHRAVNAVRFVCEAAPGIRTTVDLPQIIASL
jgi:4-hydroxy-tetrahydrodipicolinate reductase